MTYTSNILIAAAAAGIFAASATGQHLATYDPGSIREFATSACPPAAPIMRTQNLQPRTPATLNRAGAIAADNVNRRLFTTTGWPADGIDAVAFSNIGASVGTTNYAAPPGLNQITGMVLDPMHPGGNTLIMTDGYSLGPYDVTTGAFVMPLSPIPLPAGSSATGLDIDVWTNDLVVVLNDATILRVPLTGGPWSTQPPAFTVPSVATGVAICRNMPSSPMVSYFNGTVMDPMTGNMQPFPSSSLFGPRHHRGMTFFAQPVVLGGQGNMLTPSVNVLGSYHAGSLDCRIEVDSASWTMLALDSAATMTPLPGLPMIDGALFLNPATSFKVLFSAGVNELPLNLSNVTAGVSLTIQAAAFGQGALHLSDAQVLQTWSCGQWCISW